MIGWFWWTNKVGADKQNPNRIVAPLILKEKRKRAGQKAIRQICNCCNLSETFRMSRESERFATKNDWWLSIYYEVVGWEATLSVHLVSVMKSLARKKRKDTSGSYQSSFVSSRMIWVSWRSGCGIRYPLLSFQSCSGVYIVCWVFSAAMRRRRANRGLLTSGIPETEHPLLIPVFETHQTPSPNLFSSNPSAQRMLEHCAPPVEKRAPKQLFDLDSLVSNTEKNSENARRTTKSNSERNLLWRRRRTFESLHFCMSRRTDAGPRCTCRTFGCRWSLKWQSRIQKKFVSYQGRTQFQ